MTDSRCGKWLQQQQKSSTQSTRSLSAGKQSEHTGTQLPVWNHSYTACQLSQLKQLFTLPKPRGAHLYVKSG